MAQQMVIQKLETLKTSESEFNVICDQCGRTFSSDRSLRCHVKIHNEKILQCCFCDDVFNRTDTLFIHAVDHIIARGFLNNVYVSGSVNYRESIECYAMECDMKFDGLFEAEKHFQSTHVVDGMQIANCKLCDETLTSYRRMFCHYVVKHGELKKFAEESSEKLKIYLKEKKKLANRLSRKRKSDELGNEKQLISPEPSREDVSSEEIVEAGDAIHFEEQGENPEFFEVISMLKSAVTPENEETASEMLEKISNFLSQLFPLHNESYYKCAHCKLGFEDSILWMMHLGFHDAEDPLKCTGCDRKFDNRQQFVIHLTYFAHGANMGGSEVVQANSE